MDKYVPIEKLISNGDVVHILSEAKLPGEGDLLLKAVSESSEKDNFEIYVAFENYDLGNLNEEDLTFLATVKKEKEGDRVKGWYINFKGAFKESF